MRYLDRLQPLALLVMRLALGAVMTGHGYQKVFGGLHHHVQFVTSLGLPGWTAYLSAFAEFFGGILVLIGLFTRVAAFAICVDLSVAIAKVHFHNGLMGQNGYRVPVGARGSGLRPDFSRRGANRIRSHSRSRRREVQVKPRWRKRIVEVSSHRARKFGCAAQLFNSFRVWLRVVPPVSQRLGESSCLTFLYKPLS